jgi:hypothetical protein
MTTIRLNLAILLSMLPILAFAGEGDGVKGKITKEKKISKVYLVNDNCGLDVTNQYGSVYVTTWDEDKTAIDVVIKVNGNDEDKVDKRLAGIDVDFDATKTLVRARTRISSMGGNNLNMEINYTIKIPKKGGVVLNNQYGAIITGKIYGKAQINCQYGDVTLDELNNDSNSVNIQYSGTTKINYIKNGDVNAQYSQLNIGKAGTLKLHGQYTGMTIAEVNDINYKTEYGDLTIKKGGKISGAGDYSSLKFGTVSGLFNATCNYGEVKIGGINDVKNIAINATYSNISVIYNDTDAFDFEFHLDYGSLHGAGAFKYTEKKEKDNSNHYKGYNKSQGVNRMYIKSEYGDINLGKG